MHGWMCYLMCCALSVLTALNTVVCAEHISLRYLLVVCRAPVVMCHGLMCLLLIQLGSVIAYRLCYVILVPLSGDPRCTCWLWVAFLFFLLHSMHLGVWVIYPHSIPVYLMLSSSLVHHGLDVFGACVLCVHA